MAGPRIAILGAGAGGLCAAVQLKQAGFDDLVILEKSQGVGGTWHDNTYPGAACDVPSHFYSFSFERKFDWSHKFSPQPEIKAYFEHVAQKYGLLPHIRFGTAVSRARYDERTSEWVLGTASGEEIRANVLVSGLGQLNRPAQPEIPGLAGFEGKSFHSARWDHDIDLTGKRVAVIGNGASAAQFIPEIAGKVAQLTVYQRTPNWVVPRGDYAYSERAKSIFKALPFVASLHRKSIYLRLELNFLAMRQEHVMARMMKKVATAHLNSQVNDPAVRAKLLPDYPVACKRVIICDDFYPVFNRPNVELVTEKIERIEPNAIRTADGKSRPVDVLILATGFETTSFLSHVDVEGPAGAKLREVWRAGAEAYLGLTVAGFPNFFMLYGPNTNLGHNSILFMIECQTRYLVRCLKKLRDERLAALELKAEAHASFNQKLQADLEGSAWAGGCKSWYKQADGKITNNWSDFTVAYWWRTRRPDWNAYEARRAG